MDAYLPGSFDLHTGMLTLSRRRSRVWGVYQIGTRDGVVVVDTAVLSGARHRFIPGRAVRGGLAFLPR